MTRKNNPKSKTQTPKADAKGGAHIVKKGKRNG